MNKIISDISPVPVYCLIYYNISKGTIGGKVVSGYYQGTMMAKLGLEILNGVKVEDIDVIIEDANRFIFDKRALDKFNIDIEKLPKESIIINESESIYEKYALTIIIVLIILSILIVSLISIYFYKKNLQNEKVAVKVIVFGPIVFIPTVMFILIYSILVNNEHVYEENVQNIIDENMKIQKSIVKEEIENLSKISYILKNDKDKLFEYINTTRYGKSGYFFASDKDGLVFAHGVNKELIGENFSYLKDENGFYFIKQIVKNALSNSTEFVKYKWRYPPTGKIGTKYTYSKFLPQYDIVIGSGIYDEDIKLIIDEKITELDAKYKKQTLQILWISFSIIMTFTILSIILSRATCKFKQ